MNGVETPIECHYQVNFDKLFDDNSDLSGQSPRVIWLLRSITFVTVVLVAANLYIKISHREFLGIGLSLGVISLYFLARSKFLRRLAIRSHVAKHPDWGSKVRIIGDRMFLRDQSVCTEMDWQAYQKLVYGPRGGLLCLSDRETRWFPRIGFASHADFERFLEVAKGKITQQVKLA